MSIDNKIFLRVIVDTLLLVSVFILPWWFTLVVATGFILFFKFYLEAVFAGFVIDVLYAPTSFIFGIYFLTLFMVIVFICLEFIKKKLIFYQ